MLALLGIVRVVVLRQTIMLLIATRNLVKKPFNKKPLLRLPMNIRTL